MSFNRVIVEPFENSVRHKVVMKDFEAWLDGSGGDIRETMSEKQRIREILDGKK